MGRMQDTDMTTPQHLRLSLLRQIHADAAKVSPGSIPVEREFCIRELFPDVSIATWCAKHDIAYTIEEIPCASRPNHPPYTFIVFELINDADL